MCFVIYIRAAQWVARYNDEVSPGNQLKHHNKRKIQTIYWSFLDFGAAALSKENNWFTLTSVRSNKVKDMDGEMSYVMHMCLELFKQPGTCMHTGILLSSAEKGSIVIVAKMGAMIADEAALRAVYHCKGASGNIACVLCRNVVKKQSGCVA